MLVKAWKATSGLTTRLTVWRIAKPLDDALTTSADAGADAASRPSKTRYFISTLPRTERMASLGGGVQNRVDLRRDGVDRGHAIDRADQPALLVIGQDRRGLGAIFGHPRAHRQLIVVGTALEFGRAEDVADAGYRRLLELVVVRSPALRAGEAADDPAHQLVFIHHQLDHRIQSAAVGRENGVERLGLGERTR